MWDLPGPGMEAMSPALAGILLAAAPPGKFELLDTITVHCISRVSQSRRTSKSYCKVRTACDHISNGERVAAAAAKSLQSCPTLCDPIDGSPPGCPVLGILQARTLEWVAISFFNA